MNNYLTMPWAVQPEALIGIITALHMRAGGDAVPEAQVVGQREVSRSSNIVVLPVYGLMIPRGGPLAGLFGAVSSEYVQGQFRALLADPSVAAVVLDINSPGGYAAGVEELAGEVYAGRGQKPVVALANHLATSGAYWLAASADAILSTPSGQVGSIGVYAPHQDISGLEAQLGVKTTLISAGKYKIVGNAFEPLSDEARGIIQASVNETYERFLKDVARGRGVSVSDVRDGYGEGRVVSAREALGLGMIDAIGTLTDAVNYTRKLMRQRSNGERADLEMRQRRLRLASKQ